MYGFYHEKRRNWNVTVIFDTLRNLLFGLVSAWASVSSTGPVVLFFILQRRHNLIPLAMLLISSLTLLANPTCHMKLPDLFCNIMVLLCFEFYPWVKSPWLVQVYIYVLCLLWSSPSSSAALSRSVVTLTLFEM